MRRRDLLFGLGGGVAAPLAARAQQTMPLIGFVGAGSAEPLAPVVARFRQGLTDSGFTEDRNLRIEYRWSGGHYDRLPGLIGGLIDQKVDLIAVIGGVAAIAVKKATSTIPIVFSIGVDPIATGLVASLAHPGGNLTGITTIYTETLPKRFELIAALVPQAKVIGLLVNPENPYVEHTIADAHEAARSAGVQVVVLKASTESELDAVFTSLDQLQVSALIIGTDAFFNSQRERLGAMTLRYTVPAIYELRGFVTSGGLIGYVPDVTALEREFGVYAAKVLNGAKPADLPVQQRTKFQLMLNVKTAKVLGLTVPQLLLAQADEVIE
jgi:putative ABC transport system substrate-binding protein